MVFRLGKKRQEMEAEMERMRITEQAQRYNELQMRNLIEKQRLQNEENELRQQKKEQQMREIIERQQRAIRLKEEQEELARQECEQNERAEKLSRLMHQNEEKARHERRIARLKLTTPEALYNLRGLVRMRYQLDIEIWGLRGARGPDRHIVQRKMDMADAVLMEIIAMVDSWEESDKVWTPTEWKLAQMVKERIEKEGKRTWVNNPPWNEV
jgi:hypothetical protein